MEGGGAKRKQVLRLRWPVKPANSAQDDPVGGIVGATSQNEMWYPAISACVSTTSPYAAGLRFALSILCAMPDGKDFYTGFPHSIDSNVRQRSEDQLAGTLHAPDPAPMRKGGKLLDASHHRSGGAESGFRLVLSDALADPFEVGCCFRRSTNIHLGWKSRSTFATTRS